MLYLNTITFYLAWAFFRLYGMVWTCFHYWCLRVTYRSLRFTRFKGCLMDNHTTFHFSTLNMQKSLIFPSFFWFVGVGWSEKSFLSPNFLFTLIEMFIVLFLCEFRLSGSLLNLVFLSGISSSHLWLVSSWSWKWQFRFWLSENIDIFVIYS